MIYLPTEQLTPGMKIARNVYVDSCYLPLLTNGQVLSELMIKRIGLKEIPGVYVNSSYSGDIEVESIVSEQLKRNTIIGIKNVFSDFSYRTEFTTANMESVSQMAQDLVLDILSKDDILINMMELKSYNDYTYYHSLCVAIISIAIGLKMGFNSVRLADLATSALLHDIGKMMVPPEVLDKPSRLTTEEFSLVKRHPSDAYELLSARRDLSATALSGVWSHHEKYDGSGYPGGLKGKNIPLYGRILTVADVYDALTSERPYRKACFPKEAIEYMMGGADSHFDSEVLEAFLHSVSAYPAGTLVRLSTGQDAVVVKSYSENTLRPVVRILEEGAPLEDLDLLHNMKYINVTITGMGYGEDNPVLFNDDSVNRRHG